MVDSLKSTPSRSDIIRGAVNRLTTCRRNAPMHIALPKTRASDKLPSSEQRLGCLAANRDPSLGYVGGYLLTTARGRPIEFHYTTPVNPSPTHKILYGAELEPYILAELIGSNLVRQCNLEPAFIITDQRHILSQRRNWSCPIVHVATRISDATESNGTVTAKP